MQGGNLKFDFHPVAKLKSMTVGGRGSKAAASFGTAKLLHPARAFPIGHPATSRTDCGGAPSRPTVPSTGAGLFSSGSCPPTTGAEMFYALNPTTGRSETFQTGAGLMVFFVVNQVGESYLGLQIGHYNSAAPNTPNPKGYGVVDIILSGPTVDNMVPKPSWVVQDGSGGSNFGGSSITNKKHGRVLLSNVAGKTAGMFEYSL